MHTGTHKQKNKNTKLEPLIYKQKTYKIFFFLKKNQTKWYEKTNL